METIQTNFNNFQYINLDSLDYFFEIKDDLFDPASSFSAVEENKLPEKRNRKMEKSVISTMSSRTNKSKLGKKGKKNQQKKKLQEKELDLELSKKDSKNSIYSIKPVKEKPQKKEKNQKSQKAEEKKQQQIKQKMMDELMKETKKIVENVIENEMEKSQKNKKKNKNKKNKDKDKEKEEKEEKKNKNKDREDKEGNKKVDDFIKSIKEKKEKKEKEIQQENIKFLFYNKYKYAFIFDPSNRLKLRDESMLIDNDIINDLFKIIIENTKTIDNKDIIKELLILLDSFAEILFSTEKNRENKDGIELFLSNCVKFINQKIKDYSNDNKFVLIINTFYTMMKMKLELGNEYEELFNNDKIYEQLDKTTISEALDENIKKNEKYDIKENTNLINALFCFFLIEFFNTKEEKENLIKLNELIKSYSVLLNQKNKEQKTEIYQDENLDLFKSKYNTISTLMKLFSLFDLKRSNFYSLNIKVTKAFEDFVKSIEQILLNTNSIIYMTMILNVWIYFMN